MRTTSIPVSGPWITQKEIDYVNDAVRNAWYSEANVYNARFEKAFAAYLGRQFAIALPSCTSALHLALLAAGVGPGDEVIVPEITWIASSAPVTYVGATPVFADIDPLSWCISADSFQNRITPRTKALIIVDLYGNLPDMAAILEIARAHSIFVIEDAAQAIGAEYEGVKAGKFGDVSTFSFHGSKTLTTGEGGMLLTDDEKIFRRCMTLRDHGRAPGDTLFINHEIGYKYKMSSMQAALGLAQLERVDELIGRKRDIFSWYQKGLAKLQQITLNHQAANVKNTYWMVTAILDKSLGLRKEELSDKLKQRHIDTRPFFHPLSSLPAYGQLNKAKDNPVSYELSPYGINLPSALNLTEEVVAEVCHELEQVVTSSVNA